MMFTYLHVHTVFVRDVWLLVSSGGQPPRVRWEDLEEGLHPFYVEKSAVAVGVQPRPRRNHLGWLRRMLRLATGGRSLRAVRIR